MNVIEFLLDTENVPDFTRYRVELCSDLSTSLTERCDQVEFEVNHLDICWDQTVNAANFDVVTLALYEGENVDVSFTAATTTQVTKVCGELFDYKLY